jgi:pimeloyl-ACP methyl ester carboxylesterase
MATRNIQNRLKEKWAYIPAADSRNRKLAVFVHGYGGNYLDTWGNLPQLLTEHADIKEPFTSWDYMFCGYSTVDVHTYLDISVLIATQLRRALGGVEPYVAKYDTFALVGHSLGTLGIRQFLCDWKSHPAGILRRLKSVTLFASPIAGSFLAHFGIGAIADSLKPAGPQLQMLRRWTSCAHSREPWPEVKTVVGVGDRVVGQTASFFVDWTNDNQVPDYIAVGHIEMVKVNDWKKSACLTVLKEQLK